MLSCDQSWATFQLQLCAFLVTRSGNGKNAAFRDDAVHGVVVAAAVPVVVVIVVVVAVVLENEFLVSFVIIAIVVFNIAASRL